MKTKSQNNPSNKRKFKRACSDECTRALKSKNMTNNHKSGAINPSENKGIRTKLEKEDIEFLLHFEHLYMSDIAKRLKVKQHTLIREIERLGVEKKFARECPQCTETYFCKMRSQVDPSSSKFKKFCSKSCFLSSRRFNNTWIEKETEHFLEKEGVEFVAQYEVGRMTIDFFLPDYNVALEVNGDFWHANPDIYGVSKPFHRFHDRIQEKDERKTRQIEDEGMELYVIWEKDLSERKDETFDDLITFLSS
ncbi:hypothetical protein [Salibacterium lacus]|uniref:DUF559 domain-containing protein n=1 Tax=Salibacterium lacus TaxID=1898109 RepID=A0ABW5SY16_9BACI